jgi:hypothetical protein
MGWLILVLLLLSLMVDCATPQPSLQPNSAEPDFAGDASRELADEQKQRDEACRIPVRADCVNGKFGLLIQNMSDLTMAVWRVCPDENPCTRISKNDPACIRMNGDEFDSPSWGLDSESCKKVQMADYSCKALSSDPTYVQVQKGYAKCVSRVTQEEPCRRSLSEKRGTHAYRKDWDACFPKLELCLPGESHSECQQAKTELNEFQRQVKNAVLQGELRRLYLHALDSE